jgi:integrase
MQSMMRYRQHLGLSALPAMTDTTSAIKRVRTRIGKEEKPINSLVIYNEVLAVGEAAANLLKEGEILPELDPIKREQTIQKLRDMSPHWFRHSGASIAINSGALSLENASKFLGHSNPEITSQMYYHGSDSLTREGMQKLGGSVFS